MTMEWSEMEDEGLRWLVLNGRIDAMTAGNINGKLDALLTAGERIIGIDLDGVNYMSSAGIRVFLTAQKKLMRVGGEIVLVHIRPEIHNVLKMSGLDTIFRIAPNRAEAAGAVRVEINNSQPAVKTVHGIRFNCMEKNEGRPGCLRLLGNSDRLIHAAYEAEDMVTVPSCDVAFGLGLGSVGREWDHFKGLFGEAMVIDHHFFHYPAVKKPAVDFMFWKAGNPPILYRFLNGLMFQGGYRYVTAFEAENGDVSLDVLLKALFQISDAPLLGITFLGESRGMWGMHLKRLPIKGLQQAPEESVFSPAYIHDWMNLPVEPAFAHFPVVGVGIAVRRRELLPPALRTCLPEGQDFHVHGAVFSKGLFSSDPMGFEKEIVRLLSEFEPLKIQHLMGRSLFKNGVVGVIELEAGETDGTVDRRP